MAHAKLSEKSFKEESEKLYRKILIETRDVYPISIQKKSWFTKTWESVTGRGEDSYQKVTHRKVMHGGSPLFDWLFGTQSISEPIESIESTNSPILTKSENIQNPFVNDTIEHFDDGNNNKNNQNSQKDESEGKQQKTDDITMIFGS